MPEQVFVDASAWLAVADKGEARHNDAVIAYSNLLNNQAILVTTSLVVAETYILLRRRLGHQAAITFLKSVNESPKIEIGYANANLETEAKRILHQYHDQDFSFADAVSFALMQERGITQAFAFDKHFAIAGFTLVATL
jgi:predicted nucleic acid-binding protein